MPSSQDPKAQGASTSTKAQDAKNQDAAAQAAASQNGKQDGKSAAAKEDKGGKDNGRESSALEAVVARLTQEHDEVSDMFRDYKKLMDYDAPAAQREELATRICNALTVHADFEERMFYPAAREALPEDSEECMDHAEVEHASIKRLVAEIEAGDPDDPLYDAKVHVLGEYVSHHVCEEEEEMFSELRQEGSNLDRLMGAMDSQRRQWSAYVAKDAPEAKRGADGKRARASAEVKGQAKTVGTPRARVSRGAARKAVTQSGSKKKSAQAGRGERTTA